MLRASNVQMTESKDKIYQAILKALSRYSEGTDIDALSTVLEDAPSKRTLQRRLRKLAEDGVAITGKGRATRYRWIGTWDTTYEAVIPLSTESLEILSYVRQPLPARKPVVYDRELLDAYTPNTTYYLDEVIRVHLRRIGSTSHTCSRSRTSTSESPALPRTYRSSRATSVR
jgi:DNA-binding Lrp family transcriptional regulator